MKKSARILGQDYGLTAQEMNYILEKKGFLEGKPSDYSVTEKGRSFAEEQDFHRGTGGYAQHNRYWTTRSWDESITDELDINNDLKREARSAIAESKRQQWDEIKAARAEADALFLASQQSDDSDSDPIVGCLVSSPKDISELQELLNKSNLIVTTMSLLNAPFFKDEYIRLLASTCNTLIIDEAHHVPANSWMQVKSAFNSAKCLQFTATPFRNDGKKIDGDIVYNFPLTLAQERGYFKAINFYPIYEFDTEKKDFTVASKAVELLEADIEKGFPHLLLVRASTQSRAKTLFYDVYQKYYSKHSPVLIISDESASDKKSALQSVNDGISKIIVCVDMFSEGIDIPQLKICAIHDKYKSLPITMQFIGRFARTQTGLGEASVIANIVDDDIQESLNELYSQDADWN